MSNATIETMRSAIIAEANDDIRGFISSVDEGNLGGMRVAVSSLMTLRNVTSRCGFLGGELNGILKALKSIEEGEMPSEIGGSA